MLRFFLIVIVLSVMTLGYGWWHASTHASFHADFHPVKHLTEQGLPGQAIPFLPGAKVVFLNAKGSVLATAINDHQHNYLHLIHPVAGDCHDIEKAATTSSAGRTAWQACYEALSIWTSTWIKQVRQVSLSHDSCSFDAMPVDVSEYYADWYLWWVPLPHVGGTPYRHYRLRINIDKKDCI